MSLTLKDMKSTWVDKTELWTNYIGKKSNKWGEDISLLCLLSPGSLVHMKVLWKWGGGYPYWLKLLGRGFAVHLSISMLFGSPTRGRGISKLHKAKQVSISICLRVGTCGKEDTWKKHQVTSESAKVGQEFSESIHIALWSEWEFGKWTRKLQQEVYRIQRSFSRDILRSSYRTNRERVDSF